MVHFDKSSRRFYFSLIALITREMNQRGTATYIHIRKHEPLLKQLDGSLAERYASNTIDGMWEKIRKAWAAFLPYKNPTLIENWIESLRKAGLPE